MTALHLVGAGHYEGTLVAVKYPPCATCGPASPNRRPELGTPCPLCGDAFPPASDRREVGALVVQPRSPLRRLLARFRKGLSR